MELRVDFSKKWILVKKCQIYEFREYLRYLRSLNIADNDMNDSALKKASDGSYSARTRSGKIMYSGGAQG